MVAALALLVACEEARPRGGAEAPPLATQVDPGPPVTPAATHEPATKEPATKESGASRATCADCNVLLISLDTVRADFLECYGSDQVTAPRICDLAAHSLLFERAYSPAPSTIPALTAIMSAEAIANDDPVELLAFYERQRFLAEKLRKLGFKTAAFNDHHGLGNHGREGFQSSNLRRGFESFTNLGKGRDARTSAQLSQTVVDWIEKNRDEQFFVWAHYFDPHYNFGPPPELEKRFGFEAGRCGRITNGMDISELRELTKSLTPAEARCVAALHRAEVFETDRHVGTVLDTLDELELSSKTVVVVVADHGEEFLERDRIGHGHTLYDEVIRVPLIVHDPMRNTAGRISTPVSTILAHRAILEATTGVPATLEHQVVSRSYRYGLDIKGNQIDFVKKPNLFSIILGDEKLIYEPNHDARHRFELAADPGEKRDLYDGDSPSPGWKLLTSWMKDRKMAPEEPRESTVKRYRETLKRLEALGYVK